MKKFLTLMFAAAFPYTLFASEEAHSSPDVMGLVWRIIVFVVFAFILYKLLKNPLINFLSNRSEEIRKAIEDAKRAKAEAEAELESYKSKIEHMNRELEEMKAKAIKAAEAEKERILDEAEKTISKLKIAAENMIETDLNRAKNELKKETFLLSLKLAEEKLSAEASGKKQLELTKNYIKKIGAVN